MLEKLDALPDELGEVETLLADTGYFSAPKVQACVAAAIAPLIAMGRQPHHPPLAERFAPAPVVAGQPYSGRGHGASPEDARGPEAVRPAQAHPRAGVRHHQIGPRVPPVSPPRPRQRPRRVEPCDLGLQHEADVRPRGRRLRPERTSQPIANPVMRGDFTPRQLVADEKLVD